jgi:hypothetical protein
MHGEGFKGTLGYLISIRLVRLYVLFTTLLIIVQYGIVDTPERINFASIWGFITFILFYALMPSVVLMTFTQASERAFMYWSLLLLVLVIYVIELSVTLAYIGSYEFVICMVMSSLRFAMSVTYLSVSIGSGALSPSTYGFGKGKDSRG